jgi:serine/threonine protein kinase
MLPLAPDVFSGRQLGKYEVLCRLSTGGMAEIFLASQRGLAGFRKLVVLKQILPDIRGEEEFVRMFLDEAKVTAAFNHPNIAQVYDLDIAEGELFLAMEFVPGATLVEVAKACRGVSEAIPIGYTLAAVRDTAVALHYAHTFTDPLGRPSPVIHRDIAEKNIMVTYEGVTKLLDFGIAKSLARASRTQVGMVKGTSGYMSPEQILGEPLDARSDLFSLGVVLHECLTGMRLFYGRTPEAGMQAVLSGEVPLPSRANKAVPPELDAIVLKSLARHREDRYASTLEFARALERAVGALIWHPEQNAELMQRIFAERREQTRHLLASGQMGSGELTGEIRLAQLFANNNPFATPPQQPAPAAPAPVLAPEPALPPTALRPGETPTAETRAPPLEQGRTPTTPARGANSPRRTQAAIPLPPAAEPSPPPTPAPAPTPRRTQASIPPQATPPPPPEDTGPIAAPTPPRRAQPGPTAPPPAPPPPPEDTGPIAAPSVPVGQRRTRTAAVQVQQPPEEATPASPPPTPRRGTQTAVPLPPPAEDAGSTASRRSPPEGAKRPATSAEAPRPPPPPPEVSRTGRTEGTARGALPVTEEPPRQKPSSRSRPGIESLTDEEATVPQAAASRRVSRRPAAPPPPSYASGEESVTNPDNIAISFPPDDGDAPTLASDEPVEHTVPGMRLPLPLAETKKGEARKGETKKGEAKKAESKPAESKPAEPPARSSGRGVSVIVVAALLVVAGLGVVLLRLDGGLISSELPTLKELMTPSHNPGDLQPLQIPEEGSTQTAPPPPSEPPAKQSAPAAAPQAQAAAPAAPTAQPSPADAGTTSAAAPTAPAAPQAAAPAAPAAEEDDGLTALQAPAPKASEDPRAKRQRSTATSTPTTPPKRGARRPGTSAGEEEASSAAASAETGLLSLNLEPSAQVFLGGRALGETPLSKVSLPVGRHSLRLIGPDGQARRLSVDIKPGDTTSVRMQLELLARE